MFRSLSIWLRRRSRQKESPAVLATREAWWSELERLPAYQPAAQAALAILRLDDIGDYLLFRNSLACYRESRLWQGYRIVLIGNAAWRSLFTAWDATLADETIWVDKGRYWQDREYRNALWAQLRAAGYTALVCPSRTRPLLLDDLIAAAIAAPQRFAVSNTYPYAAWNNVSDTGYNHLFPGSLQGHEFRFNMAFAAWVNKVPEPDKTLSLPLSPEKDAGLVVCFIGASAGSKRWPQGHWIRLLRLLQQAGYRPLIAGGPQEQTTATAISSATGVASCAGRLSLPDMVSAIAAAGAVVSGDTMAAHAAVACSTPLVILANGVNAARFADYSTMGLKGVATCYTAAYRTAFRKQGGHPAFFEAVSGDMHSIHPETVMSALRDLR